MSGTPSSPPTRMAGLATPRTAALSALSLSVGRGLGLLLRLPIHAYRLLLSPLLPARCRFHPSCSAYALGALETHGPFRGSWLTFRRLCRCHPFHPGGVDPVPPLLPRSR